MRSHHVLIRALTCLLAAASLSALVGCNTVAGVGEDLEAAGEGLEGSAEREKRY
jgi:predicted small secreted protein